MPNHIHFIIHAPRDKKSLNKWVGNGKRFMAYEIVARLEKLGHKNILQQLSENVIASDRGGGKKHHVFFDSFDAREIFSEKMLIQKLNYMHHNPVSGKWNLVSDFVLYSHSSAKFYETGIQGVYKITHYKNLWG